MRLRLCAAGQGPRWIDTSAPRLSAGSGPGNDLPLAGARIAQTSFVLHLYRDLALVEPRYASRGLLGESPFANGATLDAPHLARPGDRFSCGGDDFFQLEIPFPGRVEATVRDPETPLDMLLLLAPFAPDAFLANPALPLFLLGDTARLLAQPGEWIQSVFVGARVPSPILLRLALERSSDGLLMYLARHPGLTAEMLLSLSARAADLLMGWRVLESIARHPNSPPALLRQLFAGEAEAQLLALAQNPSLPEDLAHRLYALPELHLRPRLAKNPATPAPLLEAMLRDPDFMLRAACAANPLLSPAQRAALARDPDEMVRAAVAGAPGLAPEVALRLAQDPTEEVRAALAKNPAAPSAALDRVAAAASGALLGALAENPASSVALLEDLAARPDGLCLAPLGRNPALPTALAISLLDHPQGCLSLATSSRDAAVLAVLIDALPPEPAPHTEAHDLAEVLLQRPLPEDLWMRLVRALGRV